MTRTLVACFVTLVGFISGTAYGDTPVALIVGESQFFHADNIKILDVTTSGKGFEIGATVTVEGVYSLNSTETADLCFFSTEKLKPGQKPTPTPIEDSQRMRAQKGEHIFKLSKVIQGDGNPHLTFYHTETGKPFGGVYFGEKTNVLMKKSWSYDPPLPEASPDLLSRTNPRTE